MGSSGPEDEGAGAAGIVAETGVAALAAAGSWFPDAEGSAARA
jgi:hypothetical protein